MARAPRFGICTDQNMSWEETVSRWRRYEELGYDSVWDCDHMVQPSRPDGPYFEGWTLLAALAVRTERIRIGVLVTCNTFRHPSVLAKQAVTVDHISGGRLEVGLGAGWYEPEHERFGIPFPETGELVGRFRESVEVLDRLLSQDVSSYEGRYYQLREAPSRPATVQRPRPPFTLGAFGPRMLRIVARHAETWNAFGTTDEMLERNRMLDAYCAELGRDPDTLNRSIYYWKVGDAIDPWESPEAFEAMARSYMAVGINQFVVDQPDTERLEMAARVASEVLPRLRRETVTTPEGGGEAGAVWHRPADYI
ncbi:MAG TPA: LLM class flavin-dependent oxidoreductase [Candidatus Dormibacteraeota bacterium]|jgi:alkanesulfonate monooxygenase SsuD/methylene tetrahydromethanopterin reductase-like flavin-dependent oxidoreductase (luciferase family)|nr:LLM class flavin-dependent oxidoreductase [Candidatus Dormibacteraeota bacterium]